MKKKLIILFSIIFCLTSTVGYSDNIICEKTSFSCPDINFQELIKRDGIYYKKFSDVPFTGDVFGKKKGFLKKGIPEGSWVSFYDNGQLDTKGNFKNGKKEGSWVSFYDNGQLEYKRNFKNGKKDGLFSYYDNGQLQLSGQFKKGKKDGQFTFFKDGQLQLKIEYKNGTKIIKRSIKSNLPDCLDYSLPIYKHSNEYRHNCYGGNILYDGSKYIGEWKFNKFHGQGMHTSANGEVKREGIWQDDVFQYSKKLNP